MKKEDRFLIRAAGVILALGVTSDIAMLASETEHLPSKIFLYVAAVLLGTYWGANLWRIARCEQ